MGKTACCESKRTCVQIYSIHVTAGHDVTHATNPSSGNRQQKDQQRSVPRQNDQRQASSSMRDPVSKLRWTVTEKDTVYLHGYNHEYTHINIYHICIPYIHTTIIIIIKLRIVRHFRCTHSASVQC